MILAAIVTIYGLLFLIRGKGLGKDARSHPQYRLLGVFLLTFLPVQFVTGFVMGMVYVALNSDLTIEQLEQKLKTPSLILGVVFVVIYLGVAHFWEKSIKRKTASSPG